MRQSRPREREWKCASPVRRVASWTWAIDAAASGTVGSDGSRANQIRPFTTLWWAVTGKMVGGKTVLREPIGREEALIAHTRKNAYLVFRENDLGSIEPANPLWKERLKAATRRVRLLALVIALVAFIGLRNGGLIVAHPGTLVTLQPDLVSADVAVVVVAIGYHSALGVQVVAQVPVAGPVPPPTGFM